MATGWRQLLHSGRAEQALSAVAAIAGELRAWPDDHIADASLFNGHSGLAVFFAYLAQSPAGEAHGDYERVLHHLKLAFEKLPLRAGDLSFATGFAGVAWALAHVNGLRASAAGDSPDQNVEIVLKRAMDHEVWGSTAGLFEGLAGIGVSLFERLPRPQARIALGQLADRIQRLAVDTGDGLAWWTPPSSTMAMEWPAGPRANSISAWLTGYPA